MLLQARVAALEAGSTQADQRGAQAEQRAAAAEARATQAEQRAAQAEQRTAQAEQKAAQAKACLIVTGLLGVKANPIHPAVSYQCAEHLSSMQSPREQACMLERATQQGIVTRWMRASADNCTIACTPCCGMSSRASVCLVT